MSTEIDIDIGQNGQAVWNSFLQVSLSSLSLLLEEEDSLETVCMRLERFRGRIDDDILDFIVNVAAEVDADREGFVEVQSFLQKFPTPQELRGYMETPT